MQFSHRIFHSLLGVAVAQQAGVQKQEEHPDLLLESCTIDGGCQDEWNKIVLDSSRRWVHDARTPEAYENCIKDEEEAASWDPEICPDPLACANNCAVDGVDAAGYSDTYGIRPVDKGVQFGFITGTNVGGRIYVMDSDDTYKMFRLKNREIAFDVDVSTLPCGANAAMYMVQMDQRGGQGVGGNSAGAKFGTGYCDAQCPHQLKFIQGEANMNEWNGAEESGHFGSCCAEMDLWEANNQAQSFTAHPCTGGPARCEGTECGDSETNEHYLGLCDKDGCDYNPFRFGQKDFFGPGKTLDSMQPITVITQFLTTDGTDGGDLAEIRRVYIQNGQVIKNAESQQPGLVGDSMSDAFCSNMKQTFINTRAGGNPEGEFDQFNAKGGLKAMGDAMDAGMVLVLSLWDDPLTAMHWLDSDEPKTLPESVPGVARGPCPRAEGHAEQVESSAAGASATYSNIRYGEIGSTYPGQSPGAGPAAPAEQPAPVIPEIVAQEPYGAGSDAYGPYGQEAYGAGAYGAGAYGPDAYGAGVYGAGVYGADAYTYAQDPYAVGGYGAGVNADGTQTYGAVAYSDGSYGAYPCPQKVDSKQGPIPSFVSSVPRILGCLVMFIAIAAMAVLATMSWRRAKATTHYSDEIVPRASSDEDEE